MFEVCTEFGPCLSPNVADHPLRSAIDRSLGKPLPYQLANQVRAHLLEAIPRLSLGLSPPTFLTTYELFKPSNSELR